MLARFVRSVPLKNPRSANAQSLLPADIDRLDSRLAALSINGTDRQTDGRTPETKAEQFGFSVGHLCIRQNYHFKCYPGKVNGPYSTRQRRRGAHLAV